VLHKQGEISMRFNRLIGVTSLVLAALYGQVAFGFTVNGDIESDLSDATYSGDDGILSSSGGSTWNSIVHFVDTPNLLDEFGNATGIGVTWTSPDFGAAIDPSATNDLQNSGTWGSGFDITGLQSGLTFDLAIYAMRNAGGCVTDASGSNCGFWTIGGPPTYIMPGVEGQDYALFTDLVPFDLGGGVYGIQLSNFDGAVTGFQLTQIPLPAALWLFGSGLIGLIGIARRKKA
jgi:hypothetical protein